MSSLNACSWPHSAWEGQHFHLNSLKNAGVCTHIPFIILITDKFASFHFDIITQTTSGDFTGQLSNTFSFW